MKTCVLAVSAAIATAAAASDGVDDDDDYDDDDGNGDVSVSCGIDCLMAKSVCFPLEWDTYQRTYKQTNTCICKSLYLKSAYINV